MHHFWKVSGGKSSSNQSNFPPHLARVFSLDPTQQLYGITTPNPCCSMDCHDCALPLPLWQRQMPDVIWQVPQHLVVRLAAHPQPPAKANEKNCLAAGEKCLSSNCVSYRFSKEDCPFKRLDQNGLEIIGNPFSWFRWLVRKKIQLIHLITSDLSFAFPSRSISFHIIPWSLRITAGWSPLLAPFSATTFEAAKAATLISGASGWSASTAIFKISGKLSVSPWKTGHPNCGRWNDKWRQVTCVVVRLGEVKVELKIMELSTHFQQSDWFLKSIPFLLATCSWASCFLWCGLGGVEYLTYLDRYKYVVTNDVMCIFMTREISPKKHTEFAKGWPCDGHVMSDRNDPYRPTNRPCFKLMLVTVWPTNSAICWLPRWCPVAWTAWRAWTTASCAALGGPWFSFICWIKVDLAAALAAQNKAERKETSSLLLEFRPLGGETAMAKARFFPTSPIFCGLAPLAASCCVAAPTAVCISNWWSEKPRPAAANCTSLAMRSGELCWTTFRFTTACANCTSPRLEYAQYASATSCNYLLECISSAHVLRTYPHNKKDEVKSQEAMKCQEAEVQIAKVDNWKTQGMSENLGAQTSLKMYQNHQLHFDNGFQGTGDKHICAPNWCISISLSLGTSPASTTDFATRVNQNGSTVPWRVTSVLPKAPEHILVQGQLCFPPNLGIPQQKRVFYLFVF